MLEFESAIGIENLLKSASYTDLNASVPTYSHFLWLRNDIHPTPRQPRIQQHQYDRLMRFQIRMTEDEIFKKINEIENVSMQKLEKFTILSNNVLQIIISHLQLSNQMVALHECLKLDETDTRLRFVTAYQIEKSISCLFPNVQVLPFGSSINGFGKYGSDLDLVMSFNNLQQVSKTDFYLDFNSNFVLK